MLLLLPRLVRMPLGLGGDYVVMVRVRLRVRGLCFFVEIYEDGHREMT